MAVFLLAFAGLYGLIIGSFLNVVAYRVPAGISLLRESRCPTCDAPVRWWQNVPVVSWIALRGQCAHCGSPIGARYPIVEALTGVAFVGVAGWALRRSPSGSAPAAWATDPVFWIVLLAFLAFAAVSIVLTIIDLDTKRLPNVIVLPSIAVGIVLLAAAAAVGAATGSEIGWGSLLRALTGAAILFAFYFAVRLISPRGMGGGDVKLAALVGLFLGWSGWAALAVGAFAAFVLGGVFGLALMLFRRAGRKTAIPFGPWMIAGAWLGILLGESIGNWYIGILGFR